MLEDDLDDAHLCIKCSATIVGLDNYVQHRKNSCGVKSVNPISRDIVHVDHDHQYGTFDFVGPSNYHKATEEVDKASKSLTEAYELPYDLGADVFFSSLELQSSSKRGMTNVPTSTGLEPVASGSASTAPVSGSGGKTSLNRVLTRKAMATIISNQEHDDDWIEPTNNSENLMKAVRDISGNKKCESMFKMITFNHDSPEPTEDEDDEEDDFTTLPSTHTGGRWKSENQPLRSASPSWSERHHWDIVVDPNEENRSKSVHENDEDDQDFHPPPCHTKGKWIPGSKIKLDYKEEVEIEKIFTDQFWCNTCNRKLATKLLFERHIKSKLHIKRSKPEQELELVSRQLRTERTSGRIRKPSLLFKESSLSVSKSPSKIKQRHRHKYFTKCDVCKTRISKRLLGKHLISHYHCRRLIMDPATSSHNMILENMDKIVHQSPYQCQPCHFYTNTEHDFMLHWNSTMHTDIIEGDGIFWCSFCKFECEDNNQMRRHLSDAEHKEVVLAINRSVPIIIRKRRIISCSKCNKIFRYNIELRNHAIYCTSEPVGTASNDYQSKFKCDVCGLILKSRLALQKHDLIRHKRRKYFCSACKINFETPELAKRHRNTTEHKIAASNPKNAKNLSKPCKICGVIVKNLIQMKAHLQQNHPEEKHTCSYCGKAFVLPQEVGRHVRDRTCRQSQPRVRSPIALDRVCDASMTPKSTSTAQPFLLDKNDTSDQAFVFEKNNTEDISLLDISKGKMPLESQSLEHHSTLVATPIKIEPTHTKDSVTSSSNSHTKAHSVPVSPPLSPKREGSIHLASTTDPAVIHAVVEENPVNVDISHEDTIAKLWECQQCEFKTHLWAEFLFHEILHNADTSSSRAKLACSVCGKIFRKHSLRCHLRQHTNEKLFACKLCPMRFSRKQNLKTHEMNLHQPKSTKFESLHQCDTCPKTFRTSQGLRQHVSTHGKRDEKFSCPVKECIFTGRNSSHLKCHLVTHSSKRSFRCYFDGCDYKGKTITHLRRHMKKHEAPDKQFFCPHCKFKTRLPGHLKRHVRIHTNEKPYKCPHCNYSSSTSENLRKHVLTTALHSGKFLYECKLCDATKENVFETNFQKEYRTHLITTHRIEGDISDLLS